MNNELKHSNGITFIEVVFERCDSPNKNNEREYSHL